MTTERRCHATRKSKATTNDTKPQCRHNNPPYAYNLSISGDFQVGVVMCRCVCLCAKLDAIIRQSHHENIEGTFTNAISLLSNVRQRFGWPGMPRNVLEPTQREFHRQDIALLRIGCHFFVSLTNKWFSTQT